MKCVRTRDWAIACALMLSAGGFVYAQETPRYYPRDNAVNTLKPYQGSPEFPVRSSAGLASPNGQDIQQGYDPNAVAVQNGVNATATSPANAAPPAFDPYSSQTPIDPNTGLPAASSNAATPVVMPKPEIEEKYKEAFTKKAVLLFTDKVSAKSEEQTVEVPSQVSFHDLIVQVEKCYISSDAIDPEHAVLLEVYSSDGAQASAAAGERQFAGWMFRKRPSLTSLPSAYYDVALLKCVEDKPREKIKVEDGKVVNDEPEDSGADAPQATDVPAASEAAPITLPDGVKHPAPAVDLTPEQAADKAVEAVNKLLGDENKAEAGELPSSD
jgi:hypothetical protein